MDVSHLLSLPEHIRIQIWAHVLTDPTIDRLHVRIQRRLKASNTSGERFSNSLYRLSEIPDILTCLETKRTTVVNIRLLRVSRLVYTEGLPILYRSAVFCPWNIEGILPIFLNTLSPFAKSNIRHIRLDYSRANDRKGSLFYWALTCAQVAQLNHTLHSVEITGHSHPMPESSTQPIDYKPDRAILYPLLKIKTPKTFVTNTSFDFQALLDAAAKELDAKADIRRASTAADAQDRRMKREYARLLGVTTTQMMQDIVYPPAIHAHSANGVPLETTTEDKIAGDLRSIPGIRQFERELTEWEVVSVGSSGSSSPSIHTVMSEDCWTDAASTVVCKGDQEDAKSLSSWSFVEYGP